MSAQMKAGPSMCEQKARVILDKVLELFTQVLGFHLAEYVTLPGTVIKGALWLCCSNKAHDIAFVIHPEPGKLHHCSFLMESWDQVLRAGDIMSMNKVAVDNNLLALAVGRLAAAAPEALTELAP